jgi:hypothetical protein
MMEMGRLPEHTRTPKSSAIAHIGSNANFIGRLFGLTYRSPGRRSFCGRTTRNTALADFLEIADVSQPLRRSGQEKAAGESAVVVGDRSGVGAVDVGQIIR